MGHVFYKAKKYDCARKEFNLAITSLENIFENNLESLDIVDRLDICNELGNLYGLVNDIKTAAIYFERSMEIDGKDDYSIFQLNDFILESKNYEFGFQLFENLANNIKIIKHYSCLEVNF